MIVFSIGKVNKRSKDLIMNQGESKLNIMDGMDAARYKSANPQEEENDNPQMPMVLRNLNNKSNLESTSPQQAQTQMAKQPPLMPE